MAEVFLAHRVVGPKTEVVIKSIHEHLACDTLYRQMFIREARLSSRLDHDNVVSLIDFFANDAGLFLVFEYVDGPDLRRVLKTCAARGIAIPPAVAAYITAHLLEALDYAHGLVVGGALAGVVHRDVSPSNILLSWRGRIKLADFGVAQIAQRAPPRYKSLLTGKFGYMSPEQVRGEDLDGRSDLFSAGVILAELLMCRRLFYASSTAELLVAVDNVSLERLGEFAKEAPPGLIDIAMRALVRDRADRYPDAASFRDDLVKWLAEHSERAGAHVLAAFLGELRGVLAP